MSTSPYPMRPGYPLGSWIPPNVVIGMKEEAKYRSRSIVINQIENDIEATLRELELSKNQMTNSFSKDQTVSIPKELDKIFEDNINDLNKQRINTINKK